MLIGPPQVRQRPRSASQLSDRDVLVPRQLARAVRARRRRPHHRLAERQPIDDHVQEAADDGAERARRRSARSAAAGPRSCRWPRVARAGSSGSGHERGRIRQPHASFRGQLVRRHRSDRSGCRAARRPAPAPSTRSAACPCAARKSSTARCSASISSRARNCSSRRSASLRCQSISADWRIACHISRDDCRSPPFASVVAASERSHHGAPGTSRHG